MSKLGNYGLPLQIIKNYAITEEQVREFHEAFGHPAHKVANIPGQALATLRKTLILEELAEVMEAIEKKDMPNLLKELCDLQYVLDGFFIVCGMDKAKEEAFMLVHQSNMSKLGPDGKPVYREDGKVMKGPYYKPVDLAKLKAILNG